MTPGPWAAVVLVLAAFRLTRLVGWDDLPPVARLRDRLCRRLPDRYSSTQAGQGVPIVAYGRPTLHHFLTCAYCQGFWTGLLVYLAWLAAGSPGAAAAESWIFYPLAPLAMSAAVGITARTLDP